jgi:hypothetical protein
VGKTLDLRAAIAIVYGIAFLVALVGFASIPTIGWTYMTNQEKATIVFQIILGASGVALAYCVYSDGQVLDLHEQELSLLRNDLQKLKRQEQERKT